MSILITGSAGFIGYNPCNYLSKMKVKNIVSVDNLSSYYDKSLKIKRIKNLNKNIKFINLDLSDKKKILSLFKRYKFKKIVHLAAQPGVRYSLENPEAYFRDNVVAFFNLIDLSRKHKIEEFIYASSSSVYGNNNKFPLKEAHITNPISFYATTKKCNELIAESFNINFGLKCTGLRFFTVYGPFGRPDMSLYKFVNSAIKNKKIYVYNNGKHTRDFTYIDDVTEAIYKIIFKKRKEKNHKIYNIASGKPKSLSLYISEIEKILEKNIRKKNIVLQKGDVLKTHADISKIKKEFNYKPKVNLKTGLRNYINWFKKFHKID